MPRKKFKYAFSLASVSKKIISGGIFLVLFYCCTPKLLPPAEADAERAKSFWNESSLASLQNAHKLYINKCGSCHALKLPSSKNEEEWKKVLPEMAEKAKLSAQEEQLILNYVLAMREAKK